MWGNVGLPCSYLYERAEWLHISKQFWDQWNLPHGLEYKFIWVDIGAEGSENDASVFRWSDIGTRIINSNLETPPAQNLPGSDLSMSYFFVADETFPLKCNIIQPFSGKQLPLTKGIFNYRLSRGRRTIKNAFGILAGRWRIFCQPLCYSVRTTENIVKATVCLHNFLLMEAHSNYSLLCGFRNPYRTLCYSGWMTTMFREGYQLDPNSSSWYQHLHKIC